MQLPYPVRVLGLDLGITSAHRGVVVDGEGQVRARRSAVPTVDSLSVLEAAALQGAEPGTRLLVVVEPTGPAWLPIAVFFGRRGHLVVRVSSAKAADLRRFLSRHAKTNGIDAETLARLPLVAPESLEPVELPGAARATLDRRVRAVARLTARIGEHKTRIRALAAALMPTIGAGAGQLADPRRPGGAGPVGGPAGAAGGQPAPAERRDRQGEPRAQWRREGAGLPRRRRPGAGALGR